MRSESTVGANQNSTARAPEQTVVGTTAQGSTADLLATPEQVSAYQNQIQSFPGAMKITVRMEKDNRHQYQDETMLAYSDTVLKPPPYKCFSEQLKIHL